ncbi:hypothetical protein AUC68_09285 [Methyloceanibacter methanicus]|uniref:Uncharacterized protein n=1 Tax=Methyloceanibacter methanicus TaxID=1774968 RepID=A0A1E3VYH0_9HYPH|nr:hypothetical protein AUC68_09285 [Methyloceanibacter methanicus]
MDTVIGNARHFHIVEDERHDADLVLTHIHEEALAGFAPVLDAEVSRSCEVQALDREIGAFADDEQRRVHLRLHGLTLAVDRKRRPARIDERGIDFDIAVGRDQDLGEAVGLGGRLEGRPQRTFAAILSVRDEDRTLRNCGDRGEGRHSGGQSNRRKTVQRVFHLNFLSVMGIEGTRIGNARMRCFRNRVSRPSPGPSKGQLRHEKGFRIA